MAGTQIGSARRRRRLLTHFASQWIHFTSPKHGPGARSRTILLMSQGGAPQWFAWTA